MDVSCTVVWLLVLYLGEQPKPVESFQGLMAQMIMDYGLWTIDPMIGHGFTSRHNLATYLLTSLCDCVNTTYQLTYQHYLELST